MSTGTALAIALGLGAGALTWHLAETRRPAAAPPPPGPPAGPCELALDAAGLALDGERVDLATAVARCRARGAARITLATDAPAAIHVRLVGALAAAGVPWSLATAPTAPPRPRRNRGAALVYRPVGSRGEPYPAWVQALRGRSGVYVIRDRAAGAPVVAYVGESHTDRLYETLTRHFQTWRRWKGFWKGQYGEGHDPGLTYPRDQVDVAVRVTSPAAALDEEERLIRRLRPRDNLIGQPAADADADAIPF